MRTAVILAAIVLAGFARPAASLEWTTLLSRTWERAWSFPARYSLFTKDPHPKDLEKSTRPAMVVPRWRSIHNVICAMKRRGPILDVITERLCASDPIFLRGLRR
jgi:hypothetical protein